MFKIGEQVAHYKEGVCEIVKIGKLDMRCSDQKKEYYTLKPIYNSGGTLYIPVDGGEKQLRKLITEEEAKKLIEDMPDIELIQVNDEKKREPVYREALFKNECREWVSLMKTSYLRKRERLNSGKKVINVDERYLSNAEQFLYGELAAALHISREMVKTVIVGKL